MFIIICAGRGGGRDGGVESRDRDGLPSRVHRGFSCNCRWVAGACTDDAMEDGEIICHGQWSTVDRPLADV